MSEATKKVPSSEEGPKPLIDNLDKCISFSELATSKLLEDLRRNRIVVDPGTEEEARQKMMLILDHRSEFPSKLRSAIAEASSKDGVECQPKDFLSVVYEAVKALLYARSIQNKDGNDDDEEEEGAEEEESREDGSLDSSIMYVHDSDTDIHPMDWVYDSDTESMPKMQWHGLDCTGDAAEEVELAIRFFPRILTEMMHKSQSHRDLPIHTLLDHPLAMPFVPLFAKLGTELGRFNELERGGLTCFNRNVIHRLICDELVEGPGIVQETRDVFATMVLRCLKEMDLIKTSDIENGWLLDLALCKGFVEFGCRLFFLLDWIPSVLVNCGMGTNLLGLYLDDKYDVLELWRAPRDYDSMHTLDTLLSLGLRHYPKELGFLYHKNNFQLACEKFGTYAVKEKANRGLSRALGRNENTPHDLLFAAAANPEISLDGVYTLLRRDPAAVVPGDSYAQERKFMRAWLRGEKFP